MKKIYLIVLSLLVTCLFSETLNYKDFTEEVYIINPDIQQLMSEKEAAKDEVKKAKANFLPKLDFTASYTYQGNPMDPVYLYTSDLEGLLPAGTLNNSTDRIKIMDSPEPNYFDFGLKLTQPIFTWGKISNGKKVYEKLYDLKYLEEINLKEELNTKIHIYYYTLSILTKIKGYILKQIEAANSLQSLSQENYNNGFIEYSSLLQIQYLSIDLEKALGDLDYQINNTLNSLKYLIVNEDLTLENLDLNLDMDFKKIELIKDKDLINNKIMNSSIIKKLNELKKIKELELKISQGSKMLLPDLALQIDLGYSGSRMPLIETDWFRKDNHKLNLTFAIKTTLYDGGSSWTDTSLKEKNINTVNYQRDSVIATLKEQVNEKIYKLDYSKLKLNNLLKRIDLTNSKRELSEIKYNQGLILETDLLEDDIEYYLDQINYQQELLSFYIDYLTLNNLLGNN